MPRGALFGDEYEPEYEPEPPRRAGKPRPKSTNGAKAFMDHWASLLSQGALTAGEARNLRPQLIEMITHGSDEADDFLTKHNRFQQEAEIWSTLEDADIELLADTLLKLGYRSSIAAGVVRAGAQGYMNIRAIMLIVPRLFQTGQWFPQHGGFTW